MRRDCATSAGSSSNSWFTESRPHELIVLRRLARAFSPVRATRRQLGRAQVVTVSDIDGFARAGGMVELAVNPEGGNLLNILINRKAAQAQNIQFNAQLLRLARVVEP